MSQRELIMNYVEESLKRFELDGVEVTEDDISLIDERISKGYSMEMACDDVLSGIRECLDEGLDLDADMR